MAISPFIGREAELQRLNDLLKKKMASLVAIKGRRRIGKSRLIEKFAETHTFYRFAGLAPDDEITAQDQRNEFSRLLAEQTNLPELQTDDWSKLFALLAEKTKAGRIIVLLDEITWMAQDDPTFLPKLKNAWDLYFKKNPKHILILCGSVSSWIEKNILSSTGYFGRVSEKITLSELPLHHCNSLLKAIGFDRSPMEKFIALSLTGGVPRYIELLNPGYSALDNIRRLCFQPDGILVEEHNHIFHDLFGRRSAIYEKITGFLANGSAEYHKIAAGIKYSSSGALSEYLDELITCGYITRDFSWSIKSGQPSIVSTYRLSDNYLRFYYRYIKPRMIKVLKGHYQEINVANLPEWQSVSGLQFENLVLNNRQLILKRLNIKPEDIVFDNPYLQKPTKRLAGVQIDYLIQTRYKTMFVCEIRFSKNQITRSILKEMRDKIGKLTIPRGFACVPVLIHINGVTDEVLMADYFIECIDFCEFLESS